MIYVVPFIVLTTVMLTSAAAAQVPDPPRHATSSARKAAKAKVVKPRCVFEQGTNACAHAGGVPQPVQLSGRGRTDDARTQWIFQGPPKNSLPFENDLSPKKTPVGGLVGLEFPF